MNISLAAAILDENLKGPTATFDELGLSAVRWAWETVKATLPEGADGAVAVAQQRAQASSAQDALIPPGFVVAPREVVERLISAAKLLQANSEGCAVNHYGEDFHLHGMPGFLIDTAADIERAVAALPPPGGGNGPDSTERAARIASDHAATAPQCKSEGGAA